MVNELEPDLVVVTGDLITGGYRYANRVATLLSHLKAPLGVVCTFGNHDYSIYGKRNITEFNYRMADAEVAHVFVGVGINSRDETADIVRSLQREGLKTLDLSEDEMAKLHVRHLVGGHAALARDELVYRFEFPERPGALLRFLSRMRIDWNISLFHYRNHGADYGRVLVGMQVPGAEMGAFRSFLRKLGYPYADETRNPAYRLFLA